jgi:peptidoglycan/LPS O-acetylase OafA/YrhL
MKISRLFLWPNNGILQITNTLPSRNLMKRNLQLDFLRFVGVFLVMMNHIIISGHSVLNYGIQKISGGGWIGVDLFFVLSGYLVSGLIFNEYKSHHSFNGTNFLIRRGFKIYPTFYFFLGFTFLFFNHFTKTPYSLAGLLHEGIFISNYSSYNNVHIWSICVEEHFYFLLTVVFVVLIKFKKVELRSFVLIYLFLLALGLTCRTYNYFHYTDYNFDRDYTKSHFRFDSLFFGVLLAYIAYYKNHLFDNLFSNKFNPLFIVISLVFLLSNFVFYRDSHRWLSVINLAVNPICFGYLMLNIIRYKNVLFIKIITPLAYIGKYSYSIYLFHLFFNYVAIHIVQNGGVLYYVLYFILSIIGGIIISKSIEYPVINFRERYFPSRATKKHPFKSVD